MYEDKVKLLEHIIYSHFGSAVGEVASLLLTRGSLPFTHLFRLSSLPAPLIHSSLLVLSLHSLLYHSESEVAGRLVELYDINPVAVEHRRRGGMYVELAKGVWEGLDGMVEGIWREGMRRREEVGEEWVKGSGWENAHGEGEEDEWAGSAAKGKGKGKAKAKAITSEAEARAAANKLVAKAVRDGFLSIVTPGSQISPLSLEIKWEEELRLSIKGIPSNKELKDLKETLKHKKLEWIEEERERAQGRGYGQEKKKKSRHRGIDLDMDTAEEALPTLPKDAFYRINTERFHIRWRSQLIYEYAKDHYNKEVAEVLQIILSIAEKEVEDLAEPISRPITVNEIYTALNAMDNPPDLSRCFPAKTPNPEWKQPKGAAEVISEICRVLGCQDDFSLDQSKAFLSEAGGGDGVMAKWAVNYGPLGAGMKRALVEALILDKEGLEAVRCWRILDTKGKLEEKHLARLAFLPVKDAREVLGRLAAGALIEQQEVPRSADRAPARTFFLWYVDYPKVVAALLDHQYKALSNLQAQKAFQLAANKGLVEKRERSDVRLDPDNLLSQADKDNGAALDTKLEALTVAEMRIDRDIFVLRELDPY